MKTFIALLMLVGLGIAVYSFSSSSDIPTASHEQARIIHFATEATYAPFVTLEPDGSIGGFETAVIQQICQKANLQCKFHHRPFDSLFPSLQMKKIDAVYGCVGITEARKKQVLFSQALYTVPIGFIHKDDFSKVNIIGLQKGTPMFEQYLKTRYPNATLKYYTNIPDALFDLKNDRIHAVYGDMPVLKYLKKQVLGDTSRYQYKSIPQEDMKAFYFGNAIAVRHDDQALIEQINTAFKQIVQDGTLKQLEQQYLE